MIGLDAGDDLLLFGPALLNPVEAGGLDVGLVRFGTGVGEVDGLHIVVGELDHFLGEPDRGLVGVALVGIGEAEFRHLLLGGFAQFGPSVAHGDVPEGREAVDVAGPVGTVDIDPLAVVEEDRFLVEVGVEEGVDPMLEIVFDECSVLGVVHVGSPVITVPIGAGYAQTSGGDSGQLTRVCHEKLTRNAAVVPGLGPIRVDQRRLGSLAGDQDQIVWGRPLEGELNCTTAIKFLV